MSHVTDIKVRIDSLEDLRAACERLGLELQQGKRTYAWWGSFVGDSHAYGAHRPADFGTCEHAIKIAGDTPRNGSAGPWEVGVVKAPNGDGYDLLYDEFGDAGQRITQRVGPRGRRLRNEIAAAKAERLAKAHFGPRGFKVEREDVGTGHVRIKVKRR